MNNDISGELTSHVSPKRHAQKKFADKTKALNTENISQESYDAAQKYYGALGHAKVNMDKAISNSISASLEMLKKDLGYVQSHIEFCDSLQEKGYSLEDAIIKTDMVFESLKDESTYKP